MDGERFYKFFKESDFKGMASYIRENNLVIDPHICIWCGKKYYLLGRTGVIDPSESPLSHVFVCEECESL